MSTIATLFTRKTEVVDVESGETCADLAEFPVSNYGAVGANLDGTPIVCGGQNTSGISYLNNVQVWKVNCE